MMMKTSFLLSKRGPGKVDTPSFATREVPFLFGSDFFFLNLFS
jgi:hypothetical protein